MPEVKIIGYNPLAKQWEEVSADKYETSEYRFVKANSILDSFAEILSDSSVHEFAVKLKNEKWKIEKFAKAMSDVQPSDEPKFRTRLRPKKPKRWEKRFR